MSQPEFPNFLGYKVFSKKKDLRFESVSNLVIFLPKSMCSVKKNFPFWTNLGFHGMDYFPSIYV